MDQPGGAAPARGGLNLQYLNRKTAERLRAMPGPGGTHRWLAQVARGLRHLLNADKCFAFHRRCCDDFLVHRPVPDTEIEAAAEFAYAGRPAAQVNFGRHPVAGPEPNPALIAKVLAEEIAKRVATYQNGSPTTIIGPPTSGTRVLAEFWRDALGGEWVCAVAGTPRTWKQVKPAAVTAAPSSGAIPTGYLVWNVTDGAVKRPEGGATPERSPLARARLSRSASPARRPPPSGPTVSRPPRRTSPPSSRWRTKCATPWSRRASTKGQRRTGSGQRFPAVFLASRHRRGAAAAPRWRR